MKGKTLSRLLLLLGIAVLGLVVHEAGHGMTALIFGAEIRSLAVMPGIQLYPTVAWLPWSGWIAYIVHSPLSNPWQSGLVTLMGSGSTAIVGYCAIFVLLVTRPKGVARFIWLSVAILFSWDGIAYSLFPLFGLRHWIIVGGAIPEPLYGAVEMGVSLAAYYTGLALHLVASNGLVLYYRIRIK